MKDGATRTKSVLLVEAQRAHARAEQLSKVFQQAIEELERATEGDAALSAYAERVVQASEEYSAADRECRRFLQLFLDQPDEVQRASDD